MSNRIMNSVLVSIVALTFANGCVRARGQNEETTMKSHALAFAARELEYDERYLKSDRIENEFFHKWQFWRVSSDTIPPRFTIAAVNNNAVYKPALAEGFARLVASEPVTIQSVEAAVRYVTFFLSIADPMHDILFSVNEIPGITGNERREWDAKIKPPSVERQGANYLVELWLWKSARLSQGRFTIEAGGALNSIIEVVAPKIGVAISIE